MTQPPPADDAAQEVDFAVVFAAIPTPYLVMTPDLVIVEANPAYLHNVGRTREEIVGRPVFEAFPPTDDALDEHGVPRIRVSFERALATRRTDTMPLQKYDIPNPDGPGFTERHWSLISIPVLGADGEPTLLVQRAENITDFVRERDAAESESERGAAWRRRVEEVETDLYARAQELAAAVRAKELASERLASLAEVAFRLTSAETVEDMTEVVFTAGLPVLGASGGAIAVRNDGDVLRVIVTDSLGPQTQQAYAQMPLAGPMPTSLAARGEVVLVPDEDAAAGYPGLPEALVLTGTRAWAALPLRVGRRLLGSLSVGWAEPHPFPPEEVELLRAFAAQCAQVLDRIEIRQAERHAAAEVQRIAETLQRSLLTAPPVRDGLRIAVRYQPASQVAKVGGDWYDAFLLPDGSTRLVIGDVAGHDQDAAAAMAQVRNVLRGITQALGEPPAAVLAVLDRALSSLGVGVLATVVLGQLTGGPDAHRPEPWSFRWCNAGHPPPVLQHADGTVELLSRRPDLLAGLLTDVGRTDHEVELAPGDTVLLYTDGLIETRGGDIEADLDRLLRQVADHQPPDGPQALVDRLLGKRPDHSDDVALLAVQVV